jgi:hypothetical protein
METIRKMNDRKKKPKHKNMCVLVCVFFSVVSISLQEDVFFLFFNFRRHVSFAIDDEISEIIFSM